MSEISPKPDDVVVDVVHPAPADAGGELAPPTVDVGSCGSPAPSTKPADEAKSEDA